MCDPRRQKRDRPRRGRAALVAAACLLPALALAGDVFTYTDESGVVHYTNIRPEAGRQFRTIHFPCYASDPACRGVDWEQVPLESRAFSREIRLASRAHSVEESLIRAVIHAESGYQPDAVSPRGARGLMQLMPATQDELQIADPFQPASNIDGGTLYLARLLSEFGGDVALATAAYNAGPGPVKSHGGVPPYPETREYVRRVAILYRRYRQSGS